MFGYLIFLCIGFNLYFLQVRKDLLLPLLPPSPGALGNFANNIGPGNNAVLGGCRNPLGMKVRVCWFGFFSFDIEIR